MDYAAAYGELHRNNKYFAGISIRDHVAAIADLVHQTAASRLLDYGCGKGYQYLADRVHLAWGGILPHCYDVGVRQLSTRPEGKFDGVICTDMLEHIEEADLPRVLDDIFGYADDCGRWAFVFFSISCAPARKKTLPDGRNVHVTVRPPAWWDALLAKYERPGLLIAKAYEDVG